jgi:hypothetical protein
MSPAWLFVIVVSVGIVITGIGLTLGFRDRLADSPQDFAAPENPFRPVEEARDESVA